MVFYNITPPAPPTQIKLGPNLNPHVYQPLQSGRHIRLLSIRSNAVDGVPHFQLIHHELDLSPPYQTLSYTWGSGARDLALPVFTGGAEFHSLRITQALHKALPFIAKECSTGFIWIDQICIDQENVQERSAQVAIMADIYACAASCLVWLGEASQFSHVILMNLMICALPNTGDYRIQDAEWTKADTIESYRQPLAVRQQIKTWMRECPAGYEVAMQMAMAAVIELMSFAWFTRVWILQEVKRSRKVCMLIGSEVWAPCQIHQLVTAVDSIIRGDRIFDYSLWNSSPGWRVFDFIASFQDPTSFQRSFYGILTSMRYLKIKGRLNATDHRDFVYGILGFCDDRERVRIEPNYELKSTVVFSNAARRILALEGALDMLLISECASRPDQHGDGAQVADLPSWVPDWSSTYAVHPLHTLRSRSSETGEPSHVFHASAGRKYVPSLEHQSNELSVRGKIVGVVGTAYKPEHTQLLVACYNAALHPVNYPVPFATCFSRLQRSMQDRGSPVDERSLIHLLLSADRNQRYHSHYQNYAEDQRPTFSEHVDQLYQIYHRHREQAASESQAKGDTDIDLKESLEALSEVEHEFLALLENRRMQTNDLREPNCQLCTQDEHGILTQQCSDAVRQPLIEHLFMTSTGTFGGSNHVMLSDDFICILHGHDYPAILRQADLDRYQYVGSCVLEKGMFGELMDWEEENADTFILV